VSTKLLFFAASILPLSAADLIVKVTGLEDKRGQVACALYSSAEGFPMDPAKAKTQRLPATPPFVECRFPDLKPGSYAVAVSVDWNGNQKTDKNFLGMPTEPWGVSRNVRPKLRAPRFDEAVFDVKDGPENRLEIQVAK
jgi:uncharacterized protein (DUF2141 family)